MSKQLLIYSKAKAVSSVTHRNWSVKVAGSYEFAREANSVPLTAVEFMSAAADFPIVFAGSDEQLMPLAIMGVRDKENLFVDAEGKLDATYIPAYLRRYPFVFSSTDKGENLTLCIDESFSGCNQENIGERLFDAEGEQTQYLKSVLDFLQEYQRHFVRTQAFCKTLQELDLLEPMGAKFTPPAGEQITLTGFYAVNRQKLKELSSEAVMKLLKNDGMELLYLHLYSLRNFNSMLGKIGVNDPVVEENEPAVVEEESDAES